MWGLSLLLLTACERTAPSTTPADTPSMSATPPADSSAEPATPADPKPSEPTPAPAPKTPPQQRAAQDLLTTIEALGALHQTHAADCDALATALRAFDQEHGQALARTDPQALAWIDAHQELRLRMADAMGSVMTVSMRCVDHPSFAAIQREGPNTGPNTEPTP